VFIHTITCNGIMCLATNSSNTVSNIDMCKYSYELTKLYFQHSSSWLIQTQEKSTIRIRSYNIRESVSTSVNVKLSARRIEVNLSAHLVSSMIKSVSTSES